MLASNTDLQRAFAAATNRRACAACKGSSLTPAGYPCRACLPAAVHAFEATQQLAVDTRAARKSRRVFVRAAESRVSR